MKKKNNAFDKVYDALFAKMASGVQFNIMDLSKMRADVLCAVASGTPIEKAMEQAISKYRQN